MKTKILFIGPYVDPSGYGTAARDWIDAISKNINTEKYDFRVFNTAFDPFLSMDKSAWAHITPYEFTTPEDMAAWIEDNNYIALFHMTPNMIIRDQRAAQFLHARRKVSITVWETTKLPTEWVDILNRMDAVVVPCTWNKEVFEKELKIPVIYIPHVVGSNDISTALDQHFASPYSTEPFVILSVSQWIERKGFDILLKAYLMEFACEHDVLFVLKSYRLNTSKEERAIIRNDIARLREVVFYDCNKISQAPIYFVGDLLNKEQMRSLYASADLFALTSRGEGFGLPYSEAIAAGIPVLCPDKGGHLDFINPNASFLVKSEYEPCCGMSHIFHSNMDWIETSIKDTRRQLRAAYTMWKQNKPAWEKYRKNTGAKLDQFTPDVVGKKFNSLFETLI